VPSQETFIELSCQPRSKTIAVLDCPLVGKPNFIAAEWVTEWLNPLGNHNLASTESREFRLVAIGRLTQTKSIGGDGNEFLFTRVLLAHPWAKFYSSSHKDIM